MKTFEPVPPILVFIRSSTFAYNLVSSNEYLKSTIANTLTGCTVQTAIIAVRQWLLPGQVLVISAIPLPHVTEQLPLIAQPEHTSSQVPGVQACQVQRVVGCEGSWNTYVNLRKLSVRVT